MDAIFRKAHARASLRLNSRLRHRYNNLVASFKPKTADYCNVECTPGNDRT